MWQIIEQIFPYAIAFTIPLLIVALGGLFCERSGIVNIGLEGLMIIGSFAGGITISLLQNRFGTATWTIYVGLLVVIIAGAIFSLLHAFASINLQADQTISGTAINMIAAGLTIFLARNITGSGNIVLTVGLAKQNVKVLSSIPILGPLFFTNSYSTTWLVLLILAVFTYLLYKTSFGLRLRACGEHPHAADAAGINVSRMRYLGVIISGAFAGLGGGIYLVTFAGEFNGSVSGLGFLAIAALIFGQWKPLGVLAATLFFGFASTVSNVSQVIPGLATIPPVLLKIFPYVITLIALIIFSKTTRAPKAAGEPFDPGKR